MPNHVMNRPIIIIIIITIIMNSFKWKIVQWTRHWSTGKGTNGVNKRLLEILVCPLSKDPLRYRNFHLTEQHHAVELFALLNVN